MKRNPLIMTIGALLILIFGLLLFLYQVRKSEVAVVTRFGKPVAEQSEPGLYFKLPWPIHKVHKLDSRIQNFEDKFEEILMPDGNNLLVQSYVGWRISQPSAFFPKFASGSVTEAERALEAMVRSAKAAIVTQHKLADFISANEKELKIADVEKQIMTELQQQVQANNYGIEIQFVGLKRLGLPESVTQAVFERMQSERQVLVSRIESEGSAQATIIRAEADAKSAQMIAEADAEATRIRSRGEAKAAASLEIFKQDPELATFLLNLSGAEALLKEKSTLILDPSTTPIGVLNKPQPSANR